MDLAVFGLLQARDAAQRRALARAAGTEQGEKLSLVDVDAHVLNGANLALFDHEALFQVVDFEHSSNSSDLALGEQISIAISTLARAKKIKLALRSWLGSRLIGLRLGHCLRKNTRRLPRTRHLTSQPHHAFSHVRPRYAKKFTDRLRSDNQRRTAQCHECIYQANSYWSTPPENHHVRSLILK